MDKRSNIILAIGNSGTGKRTICKEIESQWGYKRLSPDDVRRDLGKDDYYAYDTHEVMMSLLSQFRSELAAHGNVLIHSHMSVWNARDTIYDIANEFNANLLVVECHAPDKVAKNRIKQRQGKDHLHCPPTDVSVYDRVKRQWDFPEDELLASAYSNISHIRYDSSDSSIERVLVRDLHGNFVNCVQNLLEKIS